MGLAKKGGRFYPTPLVSWLKTNKKTTIIGKRHIAFAVNSDYSILIRSTSIVFSEIGPSYLLPPFVFKKRGRSDLLRFPPILGGGWS